MLSLYLTVLARDLESIASSENLPNVTFQCHESNMIRTYGLAHTEKKMEKYRSWDNFAVNNEI